MRLRLLGFLAAASVGASGGTGCGSSATDHPQFLPEDAGGSSDAFTDEGGGDQAAPDGGGAGSSGLWVTGYYPSWVDATNDPPNGSYAIGSIDWGGLSEVASAFYIPDGSGGWASGSFDQATATALLAAAHKAGKKAIASIGGASSGNGFDGSVQSSLSKFLGNIGALVTMGYDGIDIDWECDSTCTNQTLQTQLIQGIRAAHPGVLLTITAGYVNKNLAQPSDFTFYGNIAAGVDRINLMTYGMCGAYSGWESWHSSPLHWNSNDSTPTGIDDSVGYYLSANVPKEKLGVGIGFYGECYTSPVTSPAQMLGGSTIPASDGVMSYANIMAGYYSAGAYHYDSSADVPFLTLSGSNPEKCTYVTYEDSTSIAAKAAWVKQQGLGGVIIWSIDEGYVAAGSSVAAQNPLLEVTKTSFLE